MASPDGRPVFFASVPWHEERIVSCDCEECTCGDSPSPKPKELTQADYDQQPKGV